VLCRRTFLVSLASWIACGPRKVRGYPGYAFVANSGGAAVAVVDLSVLAAVRHVRLDDDPIQVAWDKATRAVYALGGHLGRVYRIDPFSHRLRGSSSPTGAERLLLCPTHGGCGWLLRRDPAALLHVDLASLIAERVIQLPELPLDFDLSPQGNLAAVSLPRSGRVGLIDLEEGRVRALVKCGDSAGLVRFRADGALVLAADPAARALVAIDVASAEVVVILPLPLEPRHMCFKPDGGEAFVTGPGMDAVVSVHPFLTQVGSTAYVGREPGAMAACQKPDLLFVANEGSGDISVLEMRTQRLIAGVTVGQQPCFILLTPDKSFVLVLNRLSGDMAVIRMDKLIARRAGRFAPLFTMIPVGSRPVSAVLVPFEGAG